MGNWISKRQSYDIETYEGWDKRMQDILDVHFGIPYDLLASRKDRN